MTTGKKVISNFLWRFFERIGAQGVNLIVSIVLARILVPDDYGLIAIVTVIISILNVFVDSGFGNALIQKKNADRLDFSSVFWFNIVLCIVIYIFLFLASPLIATFYNRNELTSLLRVLGIQVIISGVKNIQLAYVSRTMQFKRFFFATLGGTIGAAIIGIWMAYRGYGVWALVIQHLFNTLVDTIILWITVKWRPAFSFSLVRLKTLFSYGWKLLAASLIDTVYNELRQLIIGKRYSSSDLAFYNRGQQFPSLLTNNIDSSINSILLPSMSSEQDDIARVRSMTRRSITISTYVLAPLMIGLACVAEPLVRIVLTEKWLPSIFFMRIFCITFMLYPIHTANLNAIKAIGRSDIYLKLEITKKTVGIVALLSTMWISVEAMAYSLLATSFLSQIINTWPNRKLLNYSYFDQLLDILPQISLSCFMGLLVYCIIFLRLNDWLTLIIQIPLGVIVYILGSKLFHLDSYGYVLSVVKSYVGKKE